MRKSVGKKLIFLFAALCVLIAFACVSVSKFVLTDKKELVGKYTDFVLSHDGDGQTAVIASNRNDDGTTSYTGYIAVTVANFTDEKVSKRDVKFSMRAPTAAEIDKKEVKDAWGYSHAVSEESGNYEVAIVDRSDNPVGADSEVTYLAAGRKNTSSLLLKIRRKSSALAMDDEKSERLSIILQTSIPYIDLQVFTINATTARLSVGVTSDTYNGYVREIVNLKSAVDFVRNSEPTEKSYLATVEFTLSGDVVFDALLYEETYGGKPAYDQATRKVVIIIRAGADVNLYFYTRGSCVVTVTATIDDKDSPGEERISGVDETTKIVFSK